MHKLSFLALIIFFGLVSFQSRNIEKKSVTIDQKILVGDTLTWKLLGEIKYFKKPHKDYGSVDFPIINTKLKQLNTKKIYMSGFVVPIDNKNFALSKNVFASCFFCGKAGPETIMGLKFKGETPKLKTDQYVTIVGTLRINENNVEDWIYNVENVVIIKGN